MAWTVDNNTVSIHPNSGVLTYNGSDLCSDSNIDCCSGVTSAECTATLVQGKGFASGITIEYKFNYMPCSQEGFVCWFNSGNNLSYEVLDDNNEGMSLTGQTGFDIKNVDDCEHIIIGSNMMQGKVQHFPTGSYIDNGYPCIADDPYNSSPSRKYRSGMEYVGHKIKYHTLSDTIQSGTIINNTALVELYFPHYKTTGDGATTRVISTGAFSGNTRLSAITLSRVEEIGDRAFKNCSNLKNIDWGHALCNDKVSTSFKIEQRIGEEAFRNCGMEILRLDELHEIKTIGSSAFCECNKIEELTLPSVSSYTAISDSLFDGCSNIVSTKGGNEVIAISNYVKTIGNKSFKGCSSIKKIIISSAVTSIGESAFESCSSLSAMTSSTTLVTSALTIPGNVTTIGSYAFRYCSSLTSIRIPRSVTSIGDGIFYGCNGLSGLTNNSISCSTITTSMFGSCTGLTDVTIPYNVETIGNNAFEDCIGLTSVTITTGVTNIGNYVFSGCSSLTTITSENLVASRIAITDNTFNGLPQSGILRIKSSASGYDTWQAKLGEGWEIVRYI